MGALMFGQLLSNRRLRAKERTAKKFENLASKQKKRS
jgi:hypothetical protein